jgi:dihydrofolate synthase/folylpolyglutamate synthase
LTYFEALTALAFAYFKTKRAEFQVLEVGLGGRLDATNVVKPLVCVITPISLDHTQILGSSLEEIAREKAGIIKHGCWVVISPQPVEAALVIINTCREKEAKVVVQVGKDIGWHKTGGDLYHQSLTIEGRARKYQVNIPLLGDFQLENAASAVAVLEILASEGFTISAVDITQGLARVKWPGRLQILRENPIVLVDGAHNVASIRGLVSNVRKYFNYRRIFLVFGTSCDKDIAGIVNELVVLSPRVIVAEAGHSRAAPLSALVAEFSKRGIEPEIRNTISEAMSLAVSMADEQDIVCVTGSLFVVAEALDYFSRG